MPLRASRRSLCFASLAGIFSVNAVAFGSADPFATDSLVPPRPALRASVDAASVTPCLAPAPGAAIDVLQAVDMALCNNPQTSAVWANARAQAAQVGLAQSAYLPTLDGKLAATRVDNSLSSVSTGQQKSAALTLSWLLFDFGTRAANLESARQLLSAASATLDASVQSLFLSALQAYYNAQATRAALSAARESEKASRESFVAAESRYKVGTGTPADRLQAQTAWSQATLNRIKAEGDLRNAQGVLANVMGLDANRPLALAELPAGAPEAGSGSGSGSGEFYAAAEQDVAALVAEARRRRPDLKAAEAQLKAAQAGVDAARAAGLPTVVLGAGQTWQDAGGISGNGSSLGLTLNLPLFSGFGTTYKVRAAQAQSEALAAQRDQLDRQISLDVWRAYQSLTTAGQSLKTTADLLASAEQSERVALGRYKAGVGNILDVLNAQSALAAARQQRIQALFDWRVYRATLAQSLGNLDIGLLQASAAGKSQP